MAAHAPPPCASAYSCVTYPAEYVDYTFSPGNYPGSPHMSHIELQHSGGQYSPHPHFASNIAFAHLSHQGAPPSPIATHAHLPPSPIIHGIHAQPPSPDRYAPETKVLRQLYSAMTKMQSTMKDLAERQEQILDRMSLLEQRVGRADDGLERILENTEAVLEDSKSIRTRVEDGESQDAFESRLTDLMDGVVEKLIGGIGEEIKDIKRLVKDTEKYVKFDPYAWSGKMAMSQRLNDANILGEEEQKEVAI